MIDLIQEFLACRRVAVVGVSHEPKDFSRMLYRAFRDREYDVVPVNPNAHEMEGAPCFARVQDVAPRVEAALLMTSPAVSEQVVKDCVAAGVTRIWMYRRSLGAEAWCAEQGVTAIAGECPMMFLPRAGWVHRVHRWFRDRRA
jgi:predicted CoA-binding protein